MQGLQTPEAEVPQAQMAPPNPRKLFPLSYHDSPLSFLVGVATHHLGQLMPDGEATRVPGWNGAPGYSGLLERYSQLPFQIVKDPAAAVRQMTQDLLAGAVNWRSPQLQYNLGAAVNVVASAMYATALDVNVYLINDGLAGNAVVAEQAVGAILARLTDVDPDNARGLFTFGGTGTMAYAIKAGIRKAAPESFRSGVASDLRVVITEDAHFSHETAADWLGIGSDALISIPADSARRSDLEAADKLLRNRLEKGERIATIIINGGTTYDHAVDRIGAFASLRDRLVADYQLSYRPHLHVDSVVGWAWLMLSPDRLEAQTLGVSEVAAAALREQYKRITELRLADSWGVDFHKGVGGCPVDSSYVQFNDKADLARLRKGGGSRASLHQLAQEFSDVSPVDYTLETSRAGGKAIAALASLHSLGREGYETILAQVINATFAFRELVGAHTDMAVLNTHALGYQTMVRLTPPGRPADAAYEVVDPSAGDTVTAGNSYLKHFFTWDNETRMNTNSGGVVYSFSGKYITAACGAPLSGLKFYPTSPHVSVDDMRSAVTLLSERKAEFDATIWADHQ